MSPLVRKEIRLLLPAWIVALVAATTPLWQWHDINNIWILIFVAAILALSLSPFGQEMSHGTFGLLLVQPVERRSFWRIKTGLLVIALLSAWALFALCLWTQVWVNDHGLDMLKMSALMTLLAFSGGLWTTLLLRDMVSAFFCTLVVPPMICAATMLSVSHWIHNGSDLLSIIIFGVLAAYAAAGFLWARRLFLGAQDVAWTGGQISLTSGRAVSLRWLAFEIKGRPNRWTALVKKELQLQEVTMFLIPLLALLHLAALVIHHFAPHWIEKELILGAVPSIWLAAVPLVIGCVAVAEERRLNTLESLLCLPISKRNQFEVKLAVALVLGIVLGGIIPWILLGMGGMRTMNLEMQNAVEVAALITGVAFYASTMSRGLLQAVPTILCFAALTEMAVFLLEEFCPGVAEHAFFAPNAIFPVLAWPIMTVTFLWLAFKNYQQLQIDWQVWIGNLTRAGAVAGCVTLVAIAIFDRPWELFQTFEPPHGPARISGAGQARMEASALDLYVLLPDGRLWIGKKDYTWKLISGRLNQGLLKSISGGFVHDSNWVQVAAGLEGAVAIQSDGTLWRIPNQSDIRQIGPDSDWKEIAAGGGVFLAVKKNGTLWGWGRDQSDIYSKNISNPVRIGDESDWINVFVPSFGQPMGVKRNGSTRELEFMASLSRIGALSPLGNTEGTNWLSIVSVANLSLGVRTDGSLWVSGNLPSKVFGEYVRRGLHRDAVRVGTKSDWIALSRGYLQFAALEADGTLWAMKFGQSKHPSKYADWLAATEDSQIIWALAKDGTLTCWNAFGTKEPQRGRSYSDFHDPTFMENFFPGPTRRPLFSGNILDAE
jgi:hypothetical protein